MTDKRTQIGQIDSGSVFQGVFIVASVISASINYFTVTNVDPGNPFSGLVFLVFVINIGLIIALGVLLISRYRRLQSGGNADGRGQLVRRFLLLFSLSSVVPATIVALFLGGTVTQNLDNWFDTRIGTIVEQTAQLANENVDAVSAAIDVQTRAVAARLDFEDTARAVTEDTERYELYLGRQAVTLGFRAAYLVDNTGTPIITGSVPRPIPFNGPPSAALTEAADGFVARTLYEQSGLITSTFKLTYPEGAFLYLVSVNDPVIFTRLRSAEQSVVAYRDAEATSGRLQTFFVVGYVQVVALALLLFARLGLEAASQIAAPISRLAQAAERVREGDLTARVPLPGNDDEIDTLAASFNTMTAQLGAQRSALLSAQTISEDRRQFLETLLSQVSAGVIRTDRTMKVSLANRSAEMLIGQAPLQGRGLGEVLPEFVPHAHAVMRQGVSGDASLDIVMGGEPRHIRLRTLVTSDGGCVLTFDDATRIVTAQRHMAWRDVARRIAHEIRNPLTPIQLAAERLKRRYGKTIAEDDDVFNRSLETITRQVADIGRMVDEFSNFARMPKPHVTPFNFTTMLTDTVFAQRVVSPEIEFETELPDEEIIYSGDERLLGQAVGNLVKNAIEAIRAMPEEDEVRGHIKLSISQPAGFLRVLVEDNGPGWPGETRERLLEPYVTTRERGTGLGLAIVNRVIIDHGGVISLQKRDDSLRGATIEILLPITSEPDAAVEPKTQIENTPKETA